MRCKKVIILSILLKLVFLFEVNSAIVSYFCYFDHNCLQFSLLNSSDNKMVPQYCSYGSAGVPLVPTTIFMFAS